MPRPSDTTDLAALVDRFGSRRVAVVGDIVADEFIYGRVARLSREAPVLILEYDSTVIVPGGAGNAANNVAALGGRAIAVGTVGRDDTGRRVLAALHPRVSRAHIARVAGVRTPTKTRILAGGVHSAKQQVVRIDRDTGHRVGAERRAAFREQALSACRRADAVLLSDYGTGLVTPALAQALKRACRDRRVPVLVDSRYGLGRYRSLTACTPNQSEAEEVLGVTIGDDVRALERAGRELLERTRMAGVLVTRGSRGMALFERGRPTVHVPIFGTDEIADVTGAGDTVIATMTLALAAGASLEAAARLANHAGGLVVMKRGTATVSAGELREALVGRGAPPTSAPRPTARGRRTTR
ncbi:MAG: PfkB family carbohydrate kinase [Vicinamibacterales bacterium]